jgi:hypothetical protein
MSALALLQSSVVLAALAVVLAPGVLLNVKVSSLQVSGGAPSLESALIHGLLLGVVYQLVRSRLGPLSSLAF